MKHFHTLAILLTGLIVPALLGQLAMVRSTTSSGGGSSSGGSYSVSGTVGQSITDPSIGGRFRLTSGFWPLPTAVQTTNAPVLLIAPAAPGFATISWTPATPGFLLQETTDLRLSAWANSPTGSTNPIIVPATLPTTFYRLHKP